MSIDPQDIASVAVLTGAGISAESGVPTFRGEGGLWRSYRAEDLATPHAFRRDPLLVWEWYDWRRGLIGACTPNAAHHALVEMEDHLDDLPLVTQNVDGLHQMAGSRHVVELHGDIWRLRCTRNCRPAWEDRRVQLPELPGVVRRVDAPRSNGIGLRGGAALPTHAGRWHLGRGAACGFPAAARPGERCLRHRDQSSANTSIRCGGPGPARARGGGPPRLVAPLAGKPFVELPLPG
jgi:hypothetical protein